MKSALLVVLLWCVTGFGADVLTERLQRGLFEEEANHNLDAAIKEYQAVVAQSDEQRKVVATALFRLGECYRKLGRTNEATAFYQRVTRDFAEQEQLARLANDLLKSATGAASAASQSPGVVPWKTVTEPEQVRLLQEEIKLAEQQVAAVEKNHAAGVEPLAAVLNAKRDVLAIRRLLPENSLLTRQRALLDEQVKIVEQLLRETNERVKVGVVPPTEAIPLRRELLTLQREMAGLTETSTASTTATTAQPDMTQVEADELARVKTLAKNSPDLLQSPADANSFTQLQAAASKGYYSVVEFVLSQGVSANGTERWSPPLLLAASGGHLRIVRLLLDKGANVNATGASDRTALMSACENGFRSVVELLLERGADVNHVTSEGASALHLAALKGRTGVAELLLKGGANPNVLSRGQYQSVSQPRNYFQGAMPLHLAADGGYAALVELLLKSGALANAMNMSRMTPLHLAAKAGDTNISALLLNSGADANVQDGYDPTPLSIAIDTGRPEIVALLLARGADVNRAVTNSSNRYFNYPLHIAIYKSREVLAAVLAVKPNLEVINPERRTPLLQAVADKRADAAELLLDAGANPNRTAIDGSTALFLAVSQSPPLPGLVEALLRHGADPNTLNQYGRTPLSYTRWRYDNEGGGNKGDLKRIESLLSEHGANEYLQRLSGITYTRPTWTTADKNVFYRGTNDYNRYTLFELLAGIFGYKDAPPFPDLARVTLERLEGTPLKPREISVNIEQLLRSDDCAKDMLLEWGDRISFPEFDHPLNENWTGLSGEVREFLSRCLARSVQIIVKQETNMVKLTQSLPSQPQFAPMAPAQVGFTAPATPRAIPARPPPGLPVIPAGDNQVAKEKNEKALQTFRLKEVVYGANVLRASSDPTRVRLIRREGNKTNEWVIDLTKVATNNEWNTPGSPSAQSTKLWFQHDLWLRDGDVIEVPEKQ